MNRCIFPLLFILVGCGATPDAAAGVSSLTPAPTVVFSTARIGEGADDLHDISNRVQYDVFLTPQDGMTATGDTMPEVAVRDIRPELPEDEQEAWRRRIRLIDLDSGRPIASSVQYVPPHHPERGDRAHRFVVQPGLHIPAGWLAIEVDLGQTPLSIDSNTYQPLQRRRYRARFRADSHPRLASVRTQEDGTRTLVELTSTERIAIVMGDVTVRAGGTELDCDWISAAGGATSDERVLRVMLDCAGRFEQWVDLRIGATAVGMDGDPLTGDNDDSPARVEWDPADMIFSDDGLHTRFRQLPVVTRSAFDTGL